MDAALDPKDFMHNAACIPYWLYKRMCFRGMQLFGMDKGGTGQVCLTLRHMPSNQSLSLFRFRRTDYMGICLVMEAAA